MNNRVCLCDIECGNKCRVLEIQAKGSVKRRFGDLGIICGTELEKVLESPLGDPSAFLVCGAVIALREEDAKLICVEVI